MAARCIISIPSLTVCLIGSNSEPLELQSDDGVFQLTTSSDRKARDAFCARQSSAFFTCLHFTDFVTRNKSREVRVCRASFDVEDEQGSIAFQELCVKLDRHVDRISSHLPPHAFMSILFTGRKDDDGGVEKAVCFVKIKS